MNNWAPDQYMVNAGMIPPPDNMMPIRGGSDRQQHQGLNNNFIGPIHPENESMDLTQDDEPNEKGRNSNQNQRRNFNSGNRESRWNRNRDSKDNNRDRNDGGRDRGRRPISTDRNRVRNDKSRNNHGMEKHERVSRFGPRDEPSISKIPGMTGMGGVAGPPGNIMMPGMMQFGNNMMQPSQPVMDMSNMTNMAMTNMPLMMPGMNMQPNMMGNMMPNMIPNMMDPNMIMAQQMQMMPQPIFFQAGVLLTPIPGISMPSRRERPPGCRTIFVGGLPPSISFDTISEIFQRFGEIDDIKLHKQGVCHIRFMKQEMVEQSLYLNGFRFKTHDQSDNEATTVFIDYALNRDDQSESDKYKRDPTPPRIEPFTPAALTALIDKIKSDADFAESAPTLAGWLEKGECNKKNANTFYSLLQACNNQVRRLYNEKMGVDEEFFNMKSTMKEKFAHLIFQYSFLENTIITFKQGGLKLQRQEVNAHTPKLLLYFQVAKILSAAKHKSASDHFSKQQRRNIEMWLKMAEDLENLKEEFNTLFDDEETEKIGQKLVSAEKYEQLKAENDTLICELEGYRNEAHLAKDEAERKFEKFKAHFIAQQALHGGRVPQGGVFPPLLPPPTMPSLENFSGAPPTPDEMKNLTSNIKQEAKLVAMLTSFLLALPLGATIDYLASYVRSMVPDATQSSVSNVLIKYGDIFARQKDRWTFVLFDIVKREF